MYHSFFIHSSVSGHLGRFHVLAIVNSAGVNNGIPVSFSIFISSRYMLRSGIARSYGWFYSCFLRNLHTIFHSGCINLHLHVSILFQILFPFRLSQNIEQHSLYYTVGPYWSSVLNTALCTCQSHTPNLFLPPRFPLP